MLSDEVVQKYIQVAMKEAELAVDSKIGGPFGAVIIGESGNELARAHNTTYGDNNATRHAEMNAIKLATQKLGSRKLEKYKIITNAEPCSMCSSACIKAGITEFYFGAPMEKHSNPFLPLKQVAGKSEQAIGIYGGYLEGATREQISILRQKMKSW